MQCSANQLTVSNNDGNIGFNKVIFSCSTCCPLDRVRATWVGANFDYNKVIISCSTCCPLDRVRATWVGASFDYNKVIISCSTCCPLDRVRATWVGASFGYNRVIISCSTCCPLDRVRAMMMILLALIGLLIWLCKCVYLYNRKTLFFSFVTREFFKIGILKNFANFIGKHLCRSLF